MNKIIQFLSFFLCLGLLQAPAYSFEIYFNDVLVSGLKNKSFKNCTIRFDASGNVHISAPGYSVQRVEPAGESAQQKQAPKPQATKETKYFLYFSNAAPGKVQYDIDVYLQGKMVRRIHNKADTIIQEIGNHIISGKNTIRFVATKNYGHKPRQSTSSADFMEIIIGQGVADGDKVNIINRLAVFRVNASKTQNLSQEMSFFR